LDTNFLGFFMTKYDEQFKHAAVKQYLSGHVACQEVARQNAIPPSVLRRWVNAFELHGSAALKKKFQHYDAQFRLSVLQHMWGNDLTYAQTAAVFDIRSQGCLALWERCYHSGGIDALMPRKRGKPKKMPESKPPELPLPTDDASRTRDELLAEVNYLRMENAYLKKLRALVQTQQQQRTTARKKR
jgi:transposase